MFTEILAPVGGAEQLTAALRSGADAVYLGLGNFNARRNAENFAGGLEGAVRDCHGRGVRCHVTLNTLITDKERPAFQEELRRVAACGPDAIIVQDLAVAAMAREMVPELPRHASTQMTIHDVNGAKLAQDLGFSRVVLSRELELREIERIANAVDIEIESFIHGALCMSMSGCCYLSSMLGGRSGNRGLCAQPCRLNFTDGSRPYMLSLKDMSFVTHIRDLHNAGVCSFKIEGRMKRPEYVAAVVTACRAALAGETPDMESLRAVFSRSGFTDGYLTGKRGVDMFGYRRKEDVTAAQGVLGKLSGLYRNEFRHIPVDMDFSMPENAPAALTVTDGEHTVRVTGAVAEIALNRPTTEESLRKALEKTGGTPFLPGKLRAQLAPDRILPMQELNRMRREALEQLLEQRETLRPWPVRELTLSPADPAQHPENAPLRARFAKAAQLFPDAAECFEKIILPLAEIQAHSELLSQLGDKLVGELPRMCFPVDTAQLEKQLEALKAAGLTAVYVCNPGLFYLARRLGFVLHGAPELNVLNTDALAEYARLGAADMTLSFEASTKQIAALGGSLPRGILGYGYLPLMTMRACPNSGPGGCKKHCPGESTLTDRKGVRFRLACDDRKYTVLYNSTPLYIADKEIRGVDFISLYFTNEAAARCQEITRAFQHKSAPDFPRTGGLYYRELL